MTKIFGWFLAAVLGFGASVASADTLKDVLSRGSLRVGIASETFVPWMMVDHDGDLMGFEVDVAQRLAADLNVDLEFVHRPFANLVMSLLAGESDVIISGLSISTDRAKLVLFSQPYASSEVNFLARTTNSEPVTVEAADIDGATIGVVGGTIAEFAAAQAFSRATIEHFQADGRLQKALLDGEISGVVASAPLPELIVAAGTDELALAAEPLFLTVEAMAVRPDSSRFLNLLDSWLNEMDASGYLARRRAYWFDSHDWSDRLTKTDLETVE